MIRATLRRGWRSGFRPLRAQWVRPDQPCVRRRSPTVIFTKELG
ncbi:hypothetical protein ATKI12_3474 [Kitasatospora sp. Ki12]